MAAIRDLLLTFCPKTLLHITKETETFDACIQMEFVYNGAQYSQLSISQVKQKRSNQFASRLFHSLSLTMTVVAYCP